MEEWTYLWEKDYTGWHIQDVHVFLTKHKQKLFLGQTGLKILVPLCGKTLDMIWLAEQGHTVVGVEGVEMGILQFFKENNIKYTKEPLTDIPGNLYKSNDKKISLYHCDFFDFNKSLSGTFDCVWDRCSFVANSLEDREKYVKTLKSVLSESSRILLTTVVYDGDPNEGPPFLTAKGTLEKLFGDDYQIQVIDEKRAYIASLQNLREVLHYMTLKT